MNINYKTKEDKEKILKQRKNLTTDSVNRELKIPVPVAARRTSYLSKSPISPEVEAVERGLAGAAFLPFVGFLLLIVGESGKSG